MSVLLLRALLGNLVEAVAPKTLLVLRLRASAMEGGAALRHRPLIPLSPPLSQRPARDGIHLDDPRHLTSTGVMIGLWNVQYVIRLFRTFPGGQAPSPP